MRKLNPCPYCGHQPLGDYVNKGYLLECCNHICPEMPEFWTPTKERAEEEWNEMTVAAFLDKILGKDEV